MSKATYEYNQNYLMKDKKPWFPVMGEMHYSRYKKELWEESLRKIKAGGVSIVSMYVIWIHHEEEEGVFDFEGCRDVGTFVKLCQKVGLSVFMRLGPFVHGEVRNGGFPDWLVKREKEGLLLRSNDEEYMGYVRRFWTKALWQRMAVRSSAYRLRTNTDTSADSADRKGKHICVHSQPLQRKSVFAFRYTRQRAGAAPASEICFQ